MRLVLKHQRRFAKRFSRLLLCLGLANAFQPTLNAFAAANCLPGESQAACAVRLREQVFRALSELDRQNVDAACRMNAEMLVPGVLQARGALAQAASAEPASAPRGRPLSRYERQNWSSLRERLDQGRVCVESAPRGQPCPLFADESRELAAIRLSCAAAHKNPCPEYEAELRRSSIEERITDNLQVSDLARGGRTPAAPAQAAPVPSAAAVRAGNPSTVASLPPPPQPLPLPTSATPPVAMPNPATAAAAGATPLPPPVANGRPYTRDELEERRESLTALEQVRICERRGSILGITIRCEKFVDESEDLATLRRQCGREPLEPVGSSSCALYTREFDKVAIADRIRANQARRHQDAVNARINAAEQADAQLAARVAEAKVKELEDKRFCLERGFFRNCVLWADETAEEASMRVACLNASAINGEQGQLVRNPVCLQYEQILRSTDISERIARNVVARQAAQQGQTPVRHTTAVGEPRTEVVAAMPPAMPPQPAAPAPPVGAAAPPLDPTGAATGQGANGQLGSNTALDPFNVASGGSPVAQVVPVSTIPVLPANSGTSAALPAAAPAEQLQRPAGTAITVTTPASGPRSGVVVPTIRVVGGRRVVENALCLEHRNGFCAFYEHERSNAMEAALRVDCMAGYHSGAPTAEQLAHCDQRTFIIKSLHPSSVENPNLRGENGPREQERRALEVAALEVPDFLARFESARNRTAQRTIPPTQALQCVTQRQGVCERYSHEDPLDAYLRLRCIEGYVVGFDRHPHLAAACELRRINLGQARDQEQVGDAILAAEAAGVDRRTLRLATNPIWDAALHAYARRYQESVIAQQASLKETRDTAIRLAEERRRAALGIGTTANVGGGQMTDPMPNAMEAITVGTQAAVPDPMPPQVADPMAPPELGAREREIADLRSTSGSLANTIRGLEEQAKASEGQTAALIQEAIAQLAVRKRDVDQRLALFEANPGADMSAAPLPPFRAPEPMLNPVDRNLPPASPGVSPADEAVIAEAARKAADAAVAAIRVEVNTLKEQLAAQQARNEALQAQLAQQIAAREREAAQAARTGTEEQVTQRLAAVEAELRAANDKLEKERGEAATARAAAEKAQAVQRLQAELSQARTRAVGLRAEIARLEARGQGQIAAATRVRQRLATLEQQITEKSTQANQLRSGAADELAAQAVVPDLESEDLQSAPPTVARAAEAALREATTAVAPARAAVEAAAGAAREALAGAIMETGALSAAAQAAPTGVTAPQAVAGDAGPFDAGSAPNPVPSTPRAPAVAMEAVTAMDPPLAAPPAAGAPAAGTPVPPLAIADIPAEANSGGALEPDPILDEWRRRAAERLKRREELQLIKPLPKNPHRACAREEGENCLRFRDESEAEAAVRWRCINKEEASACDSYRLIMMSRSDDQNP